MDITICIMSCGESTLDECRLALKPFEGQVVFQEVKDVTPQIKALNRMIEQTQTEFLIPVDADIILDADAYPRIKQAINKYSYDKNWHSILFNLWDTLTEQQILALKILRTSIAKENLFSDTPTPDVEHYKRLTDKGYTCIHDYLKQRPIGKHVVKGKLFCYNKYKDVYQTYRTHNFEWDSAVFMGGADIRQKAKAHFDYFMYKWIMTHNEDYLCCIAGMVDGITSPLDNKSKSLEKKEFKVKPEFAIDQFTYWYIQPMKNASYFLF